MSFSSSTSPLASVVGIIASYLPSFIGCAVKCFHYFAGIILRHLYVTEVSQQVNMSHILSAMHVAIDKLHYFSWIETICLSEVYEQSSITFLCLLPAFSLILVVFSFFFPV